MTLARNRAPLLLGDRGGETLLLMRSVQPEEAMRRVLDIVGLLIATAVLGLSPLRGLAAEAPADSRTQIVVQWPIDTTTDISQHELWALEDRLESEAEGLYEVDSHDLGSGTANIFLYASELEPAVLKVIAIYRSGRLRPGMRIGVQHYDDTAKGWEYLPVFPRGLHRFELIY